MKCDPMVVGNLKNPADTWQYATEGAVSPVTDAKSCAQFCETNKMGSHDYAYCLLSDKCQVQYLDHTPAEPQIVNGTVSQYVQPCGAATCNGVWDEGLTLDVPSSEVEDPSENPTIDSCLSFCKSKLSSPYHLCQWTTPDQGFKAACRLSTYSSSPKITPSSGSGAVHDYMISRCKADNTKSNTNRVILYIVASVAALAVLSVILKVLRPPRPSGNAEIDPSVFLQTK
jgi:hypothetical protein